MADELVSICIPVYNGEKFLGLCLESCISQSYRHFEIIVCDDCSTDRSEEVVRGYMRTEPRIKFFRNEKNSGLVGNWNNTIKLASGVWIKMLFQDDYLAPDCLSRFMDASNTGTPLLVSRRNFVFDYTPGKSEKKHYDNKNRQFDTWANGKSLVITPRQLAKTAAYNININFIAEPSLTMFRKQEALEAGLFDKDFLQVCDLDFLLRISSKKGLVYLPYDLCFFRLHAQATTNVNMNTRAFELRYLEPLLMATRLLTHRSYAALKELLTGTEKFRIRLYLNTRLMEAKLRARESGNTEVLNQYLLSHPSIQFVGKPRLVHRLVFVVLRAKRFVSRLGKKD